MKTETVYDILGIGIGPFNLGLAALAHDIPELKCKFFDQQPSFNWHPGLLLKNSRLQVPFYADLVTLADPTSRLSYMNFIKSKGRMFRFAIQENNFITRIEYNQYCQWVCSQLPQLMFGLRCEAVHYDQKTNLYAVYLKTHDGFSVRFHGKQIVIGVGTVPAIPDCTEDLVHSKHPAIFHSSDYLFKKADLLKSKNITIVGSGQSAAEIFYDLLTGASHLDSLSWFTRSERFFPMDYSKFALEMTSPDYINYFYGLPCLKKKELLKSQEHLYKGINIELIRDIYNELYLHHLHEGKTNVRLFPGHSLETINANSQFELTFRNGDTEKCMEHNADTLILATGYKNIIPEFLHPVKELINWNSDGLYDTQKNYSVDRENSIFVQNADLHSHGFNSADLGMGPYRNAIILNTILQTEHFKTEKNTGFQSFGSAE